MKPDVINVRMYYDDLEIIKKKRNKAKFPFNKLSITDYFHVLLTKGSKC